MSSNILNNSVASKILFKYTDKKGNKHKEIVKVHYLDDKICYFVGQIPVISVKPGWRTKAEIVIYTQTGTYTTRVIIKDTVYTLTNVYYTVRTPKKWEYKEFRVGHRYRVGLPVVIKFTDDSEIHVETYDLSTSGFSFLGDHIFTTLQSRFPCSCSLIFPEESKVDFPGKKYETVAKFVRQQSIQDEYGISMGKLHCFKFLDMSKEDAKKIVNYLASLK